MTITTTAATAATSTTPTSTPGGLVGNKDEFLKLFMAQLQHQDPLSPQSATDMTAQLAQFTAVEQATLTNQHLTDLTTAQVSASSTSLAGLVGRTCDATAGAFTLDGRGAAPPLAVSATGPLTGAAIVIEDADGKAVRRLPIATGATATTVQWDGTTDAGARAPAGSYRVRVDPGPRAPDVTAHWHGAIDALELTDAGPRLRMGSVLLTAADVRTIGSLTASGSSPTSSGVSP